MAVVVQGNAEAVVVEGESLAAGQADLVVPVPLSTAEVSRSFQVDFVSDADTVIQSVAFVAFRTDVVGVEVSTVLVQGLALSGLVESPPLRAFETDLQVPVPLFTAQVGRRLEIGWIGDTNSILDDEAFVTFDTLALVVEASAVGVSLLADAVAIEPVAVGTLETDLLVPVPVFTADV